MVSMMMRHEGVSCDACTNSNFRGKRWKCLVCSDYDLCSFCYDSGAVSIRHSILHPMQCILTRSDLELYFGSDEQVQSFTCPYCGKFGFTDSTLLQHVDAKHSTVDIRVVCPICASSTFSYPNALMDNFAEHLAIEHRTPIRNMPSILDEPSARQRNLLPPVLRNITSRPRRNNMNFSSGSLASISTNSPPRDTDPFTELLSHLSGNRRHPLTGSQYIDLQMQMERQARVTSGHQLVRLNRRVQQQVSAMNTASGSTNINTNNNANTNINISSATIQNTTGSTAVTKENTLLLPTVFKLDIIQSTQHEQSRANRTLFTRELLLSCLQQPFDDFENILKFLPVTLDSKPDVQPISLSTG